MSARAKLPLTASLVAVVVPNDLTMLSQAINDLTIPLDAVLQGASKFAGSNTLALHFRLNVGEVLQGATKRIELKGVKIRR